MKDHNFVPFNINTVSDVLARHAGTHWNNENECWLCFNPGIEQGFLNSEELVPRSQKPGFWARAKFVLPTGCIQEVHVAQGESALEAFQRWRKSVVRAAIEHMRGCTQGCNPVITHFRYCEKFSYYSRMAGSRDKEDL